MAAVDFSRFARVLKELDVPGEVRVLPESAPTAALQPCPNGPGYPDDHGGGPGNQQRLGERHQSEGHRVTPATRTRISAVSM